MLRLRPVVTRRWVEEQGVYAPEHFKRQHVEHHSDADSQHNGSHTTAPAAKNGSSDADGWQGGPLRPCQCRMTASPPHRYPNAASAPSSAPSTPSLAQANPPPEDETKATPTSSPARSPVATPSPAPASSVAPLSSFPASSLASLPSSSSRAAKSSKATPTTTPTASPRLAPSLALPPAAAASPATSDSSIASIASASSASSSSSAASSPAQRSEWSDDDTISRLPGPYATAAWPAVLSHILHVLTRDAISRSAFASQVHLSLSTVSRVLSGQPRVKRVEYGRMRVWLWRRDGDYVRVREGEGRGGSGVSEVEWDEWRGLTMGLEERQRVDGMLIASDEDAAGVATAVDEAKQETEAQGGTGKEGEGEEGEATDVSMDTEDDSAKEEASMDVDSNSAVSIPAATDEVANLKGIRNGGSRSSKSSRKQQSPAMKPTASDPHATLVSSSLATLPSSSASTASPTPTAASVASSPTSTSTASLSAPPTPSSTATPASSTSSTTSSSPPQSASTVFLLASLPAIPAAYLSSPDSLLDRLDFYTQQLHLAQKTVAHCTQLPLTTVSQLIRRVYKPWPAEGAALLAGAAGGGVWGVVAGWVWWLDGMLSGLVRARVGNVHDTCNLAFLSSLTVSGLSRERLNVWLDGKTGNPLYDRQWIDEMAIKEFGVTQEVVLREWEKAISRGAAGTTATGTIDVANSSGASGGGGG